VSTADRSSSPARHVLHGRPGGADATPSAQYGTAGRRPTRTTRHSPVEPQPVHADRRQYATALPANGVIYVEDAPITGSNGCTGAKYSSPPVTGEQEVQNNLYAAIRDNATRVLPVTSSSRARLYGHLTLRANNNVIADGDLTYCLDPTPASASTRRPA